MSKGWLPFKNTLQAVIERRWNDAAGMLNSRWASRPRAAQRHALQMRTGLWAPEYGA
ncbi:hypothetical protein H2136_23215 [Aeromonas hydrophila]|uniref:Uncharacterized protein n=1 Tax=Aeromonas hydrophila TaxID=644 RepID=A0A926FKN5_AERHY|nr:hypothetical protein [Aeromonas hydrophila]